MSFDPASFNPSLGQRSLQRPAPGARAQTGVRRQVCSGGTTGPNRSLFPQDYNNFAPRLGLAWDVNGDGKTAFRAGLGQFFLRERLSPGPEHRRQSAVRHRRERQPIARHEFAEPAMAARSATRWARRASGREQSSRTPNNWQWNLSYQREIYKNTTWEIGYVGNKGMDLLNIVDIDQIPSGDINDNGIDDRREFVITNPANGSLRPFGDAFGNRTITLLGARWALDVPLDADAGDQPLGCLAVPGVLHAVADDRERPAGQRSGGLSSDDSSHRPDESVGGRRTGEHRSPPHLQRRARAGASDDRGRARGEGGAARRMGDRHHRPGRVGSGADGVHRRRCRV